MADHPQWLEEAQDDATLLAIRDQERAGLDIVTDGEMRRESYSNRFANALDRRRPRQPGKRSTAAATRTRCRASSARSTRAPGAGARPRVPEGRHRPADQDDRAGPFTMSQQAQNDHYEHDAECALAYAAAVDAEIGDLFAAGADIVQIDEPYMQARPEKAREYGRDALEAALAGHAGTTAVHICFGYAANIHERPEGYPFLDRARRRRLRPDLDRAAQSSLDDSVLEGLPGKTIILGVLDLDDHAVETPEVVADRIRRALPYKDVGELVAAPDCG